MDKEQAKITIKETLTSPQQEKSFINKNIIVQPEHNFFDLIPVKRAEPAVFSFGDFISTLAILLILYSITDFRYRFRISISNLRVGLVLYFQLILLLIWMGVIEYFSYFSVPFFFPWHDQKISQLNIALILITIILLWLKEGFITRPRFSKINYTNYYEAFSRTIVNSKEDELCILADELQYSIGSIIKPLREKKFYRFKKIAKGILMITLLPFTIPFLISKGLEKIWIFFSKRKIETIEETSRNLLSLIGDRKFCQQLIASSPITAIELIEEINKTQSYNLPIQEFFRNITEEVLKNKDSTLYTEIEKDKLGSRIPGREFGKTVYGNSELIGSIYSKGYSPLDISFWMKAEQLEAYTRIVLIFTESYLKTPSPEAFNVFKGAIHKIQSHIYRIDRPENILVVDRTTDSYESLEIAANFVKNLITLIGKHLPFEKIKDDLRDSNDLYNLIVDLIYKIIRSDEMLQTPEFDFLYNNSDTIWGKFWDKLSDNEAKKIILCRLKCKLYRKVKSLENSPEFDSHLILRLCLNVMGLNPNNTVKKEYARLHRAIIAWVKKNYLNLNQSHPYIAKKCLTVIVKFDEENKCLVRKPLLGKEETLSLKV